MVEARQSTPIWPALKRLYRFLRPHRGKLWGAGALLVASLSFDLVAPLLLKELIDQTLGEKDLHTLNLIIAVFAVVYGLKFFADLGGGALKNRFNEDVFRDVRRRLYDHIQSLSLPFFQDHRSGYLTSRIFSDTSQLGGMLGNMFLGAVTNLVLVAGAVAITFYLNWRLTVVLLLVVPLLAWVTKHFNVRIQSATTAMQEQISQLCAGVQENISGMTLIQSYGLEGFASERVGKEMDSLRDVNVRLTDLTLLHRTGTVMLTSIAGLSILWFGSRELVRGTLTMGELMAFLAYAVNVYRPVQELLGLNISMHRAAAAAGRIFELFDTVPDVAERPGAPALATPVRGAVRYRDVSFAYDRDDVLNEVSFGVEPGMKVAVVGRSGAGKTTLLSLLPRFFDPRRGRVEIDGQDLRDVDLVSLRRAVGIVTQDTFMFSGSIRDNLLCIRPDASEEELTEALRKAHLEELLARLPDGLDTELGERGLRISGGERQRLSIARALVKDPPILILDEATSSVDSISENQIRAALDEVMAGGRTCFIIAHRFSTILDADRILVLDDGRLVGEGTHAELYSSNAFYARLYDEQYGHTDGGAEPTQPDEPSIEQFLMKKDGRQSRIMVRSDGDRKQVEITPLAPT